MSLVEKLRGETERLSRAIHGATVGERGRRLEAEGDGIGQPILDRAAARAIKQKLRNAHRLVHGAGIVERLPGDLVRFLRFAGHGEGLDQGTGSSKILEVAVSMPGEIAVQPR